MMGDSRWGLVAATGLCAITTDAAAQSHASGVAHLKPRGYVVGQSLPLAFEEPAPGTASERTAIDLTRAPGEHTLHFAVPPDGGQLAIPACAGRVSASINGRALTLVDAGPQVVSLNSSPAPRDLSIVLRISPYEKRIACGAQPIFGSRLAADPAQLEHGFHDLTFASPYACKGACTPGHALVYLPHVHKSGWSTVLIGVHPWNGSEYTYAAYSELLQAAEANDVVLLFPSGLGNSLYTADSENETMRALAALSQLVAVDPQRTSIWGASMGGQGATTIGFHHPDKFAFVASFFGDARFDLHSYVRSYFPTEAAARLVNPADAVANARHIPTWLLHGEADKTSPVKESDILHHELVARGYPVRFDRLPGRGHEGLMVAQYIDKVVAYAAVIRTPLHPSRVTFRLLHPTDHEAYGVRAIRKDRAKEAYFDLEWDAAHGALVLHDADNVMALELRPGALADLIPQLDSSAGRQYSAENRAGPPGAASIPIARVAQ